MNQTLMKIKSIKKITLEKPVAVYDVTVPDTHNFLLENGAVVHNCMGSAVALHYGMESLHVLGATKPETAINRDMPKMAAWFTSKFFFHSIGYNHNLQLQCQHLLANDFKDRGFYLEYGITLDHKKHPVEDIYDFHKWGSYQVKNIPDHIEKIIIPCGSANSSTSVLLGLFLYPPKSLKEVHLVGIGPSKFWYLRERLEAIGKYLGVNCFNFSGYEEKYYEAFWEEGSSSLEERARYSLNYYDLHGTKYVDYQDEMFWHTEDIDFHPTYESKCMTYIYDKAPHLVGDKTLFWIVGSKPYIEKMSFLEQVLGPVPTELKVYS